MAFELSGWARIGGAQTKAPVINTYLSGTDNQAAIIASAYFNEKANAVKIDDTIYLRGTDLGGWYRVTAVAPDVTVAAV